jgi:hypothetical protein
MKRCYICSRTLVIEGNDQNVSYLDSEICLNCELNFSKSGKVGSVLGEKLRDKLLEGKNNGSS